MNTIRGTARSTVMATIAALLAFFVSSLHAPQAVAAADTVVDCADLPGLGTYSSPHELGTVKETLIVTDCPPLRSKGTKRWFRFAYAETPSSASNVATRFVHKKGRSSVDIRLADGPFTERHSTESISWDTTQNRRGYLHWMKGLDRGPWLVGAEKITTTSPRTARYDLLIVP